MIDFQKNMSYDTSHSIYTKCTNEFYINKHGAKIFGEDVLDQSKNNIFDRWFSESCNMKTYLVEIDPTQLDTFPPSIHTSRDTQLKIISDHLFYLIAMGVQNESYDLYMNDPHMNTSNIKYTLKTLIDDGMYCPPVLLISSDSKSFNDEMLPLVVQPANWLKGLYMQCFLGYHRIRMSIIAGLNKIPVIIFVPKSEKMELPMDKFYSCYEIKTFDDLKKRVLDTTKRDISIEHQNTSWKEFAYSIVDDMGDSSKDKKLLWKTPVIVFPMEDYEMDAFNYESQVEFFKILKNTFPLKIFIKSKSEKKFMRCKDRILGSFIFDEVQLSNRIKSSYIMVSEGSGDLRKKYLNTLGWDKSVLMNSWVKVNKSPPDNRNNIYPYKKYNIAPVDIKLDFKMVEEDYSINNIPSECDYKGFSICTDSDVLWNFNIAALLWFTHFNYSISVTEEEDKKGKVVLINNQHLVFKIEKFIKSDYKIEDMVDVLKLPKYIGERITAPLEIIDKVNF